MNDLLPQRVLEDATPQWSGVDGVNGQTPLALDEPTPEPTQEISVEAAEIASSVTITFKKPTPVQIEIDPDQLKWDDIQIITRVTNGDYSEEEAGEKFMDLLTKLTGQDARKLPIRVINGVVAQLKRIAGGDETLKN